MSSVTKRILVAIIFAILAIADVEPFRTWFIQVILSPLHT